jgi:hypothetical protein
VGIALKVFAKQLAQVVRQYGGIGGFILPLSFMNTWRIEPS